MPSLFLLQVLMLYSSRKDSYPKGHTSQAKPVQEDKRRGRVSRPVFRAGMEPALPWPHLAMAAIRTQSPPAVSDMANRQRAGMEPRPYGIYPTKNPDCCQSG